MCLYYGWFTDFINCYEQFPSFTLNFQRKGGMFILGQDCPAGVKTTQQKTYMHLLQVEICNLLKWIDIQSIKFTLLMIP